MLPHAPPAPTQLRGPGSRPATARICAVASSHAAASSVPVLPGPALADSQTPDTVCGPASGPNTLLQRRVAQLERLWSEDGAVQSPRCPSVPFPAPVVAMHQHDLGSSTWHISSPPTGEKPQRTRNQERSPDYFANVGDAIRVLREDIPLLFHKDLDYRIYRDDIVFKDPRNRFEGMKNYKLIFWSLRFHGRIFFSKLYVEVKRIWQPSDDVIKMRWTVHGIPRVPWEAQGLFDGISTYKLDHEGRVYEHSVDNVLLRDPPMLTNPPLLAGLNLVPGSPQQPCPGAWGTGPMTTAAATGTAVQPADSTHSSRLLPPLQPAVLPHDSHLHGPTASETMLVGVPLVSVAVVSLPGASLRRPRGAAHVPCARAAAEAQLYAVFNRPASVDPVSPGLQGRDRVPGGAPTGERAGLQGWSTANLAEDSPAQPGAPHTASHGLQQLAAQPAQAAAAAASSAPAPACAAAAAAPAVAASRGRLHKRFSWVRLYAAWWGSVSLLAGLQALLQPSTSMDPLPSRG